MPVIIGVDVFYEDDPLDSQLELDLSLSNPKRPHEMRNTFKKDRFGSTCLSGTNYIIAENANNARLVTRVYIFWRSRMLFRYPVSLPSVLDLRVYHIAFSLFRDR